MRAPRAKLRLPSGSEAAAAKWYLQPRENVINLQGCVTGFNAGVCFFVQDYGMGGSSSRRPQCVCHHELPGIYGGSIKLGSRALKSACTRCQTCAPRLKLRSAPRPRHRRRHPPRPAGWRHSRRSRSPPAGMLRRRRRRRHLPGHKHQPRHNTCCRPRPQGRLGRQRHTHPPCRHLCKRPPSTGPQVTPGVPPPPKRCSPQRRRRLPRVRVGVRRAGAAVCHIAVRRPGVVGRRARLPY